MQARLLVFAGWLLRQVHILNAYSWLGLAALLLCMHTSVHTLGWPGLL
jgi:hypothetical protein